MDWLRGLRLPRASRPSASGFEMPDREVIKDEMTSWGGWWYRRGPIALALPFFVSGPRPLAVEISTYVVVLVSVGVVAKDVVVSIAIGVWTGSCGGVVGLASRGLGVSVVVALTTPCLPNWSHAMGGRRAIHLNRSGLLRYVSRLACGY